MTDDDAFIRTIVDRPGDDLARLVYADWLDDRGDPRGAYLRAEHEWAAGPRADAPPADGLDPVWVARVSRPPAGVCCDHVRFERDGPTLSPKYVSRLQSSLGSRLPADYQAFLLNYNGGTPTPDTVPVSDHRIGICIKKFYSVPVGRASHRSDFELATERYWRNLPDWLGDTRHSSELDREVYQRSLPIAKFYNDIFELVIVPGGVHHAGRLVFLDWSVEPQAVGYYPIPDTLPDLLVNLTLDSRCEL